MKIICSKYKCQLIISPRAQFGKKLSEILYQTTNYPCVNTFLYRGKKKKKDTHHALSTKLQTRSRI